MNLPASPLQNVRAPSPSALVVEPELPRLLAVLTALSSAGFDPIVAETFQDARSTLGNQAITLLVTDLKLRDYNGLHLVMRGAASRPHLASIVTTDAADPVLQAEAEKLGATFVVMPASHDELVAAIYRTALRKPAPGESLEPIRPPFERRISAASGRGRSSDSESPERRRELAALMRALAS
jgi:DNA-binding NtrC family response regulator